MSLIPTYVDFLVRWRRTMSVLVTLVTIVAAVFAGRLEFDEHTRSMFAIALHELAELDRVAAELVSDVNDCDIRLESDKLLCHSAFTAQSSTAGAIRQIDGGPSVYS